MTSGWGRAIWMLASLLGLVLAIRPIDARAQDKVRVVVNVIHVSNKGDVVDPPTLAAMKQAFAKQGFSFSSYRQLSSQTVDLEPKKPAEITLPNGTKAKLTLREIKEGTAQVDLSLGTVTLGIALGREGSVYRNAGPYQSGQLWLELSPVTAK